MKKELKNLMELHVKKSQDEEVYAEEYSRLSDQLNILLESKNDLDTIQDKKEECARRMQEITKVINEREELLEKFDKDLFNALADKIEIVSKTHFIFVLKRGIRVDEKYRSI